MAKNILDDIRNTIARFTTPNINSRGQTNLAYKILQPVAQAQRFIESPKSTKLVPQINAPKKANIGTQLGYGLLNVPGAVINSVVGQGVIDPAIDVGRFIGNTLGGRPLPKYNTLKSGPARLGMQVGSGLTGQKLAPTSAQQFIGNLADTANPIISAYTPKGAKNIYNATTKTIGRKVAEGALGGAYLGGAYGLTQGLGENRNAETLAKQFLGAGPQALTGAALGGVLGGTIGGASGVKDALLGKTQAAIPGLTKQEAKDLTQKYLRNDIGQFATKENAVKGLKQNVQAQINRKLGRPANTVVFPSDLKKALGYSPREELEKRIGLQARPTDDIAKAQAAKDAAKVGGGAKTTNQAKSDLQKNLKQLSKPKVKPLSEQPNVGGVSNGSSSKKIIPKIENPKNPFFNVNRLNIKNDSKAKLANAVVEEAKPQIEQVVGSKLGNQEVLNYANHASAKISKAVGRDVTLEIGAANLSLRQKLAVLADKGTVDKEFIDTLVADKSIAADTARLLQQRNIVADPVTPEGKLISEYVKNVLDRAKNSDEIIAAAKGVDFKDPEQASVFYRTFVQPKLGDWIDKLRYNSMLSSPNTHIVNSASNLQGVGIVAPIEKTILGGIDFLRSTITKKPRKYYAGEGAEYAKGFYTSIGKAAHNFADVMRGKKSSDLSFDARNIPLSKKGTPLRKVENVLDFTSKLLQASDEFFKTLSGSGTERALRFRAAKGIKVGDIATTAEEEARYRLFNADLSRPIEGHLLKAIELIPSKVMEARASSNPIVSLVSKFTFPFVRVPANILKQGIEYSPFGFGTLWGAGNKEQQLTKALMGSSIAVGTGILLGSDRLSWALPTGKNERAAFYAAGRQPYSIKIGNKWVSYSKLHPAIAFNLALAAAYKDSTDKGILPNDQAETALTIGAKWLQFFADQSYVKNMGDFIAAAKGNEEGLTRYISNQPQQLIPFRALMGWVSRLTDPNLRMVDPKGSTIEKQLQQVAMQIPLVGQKVVPARTDPQGNPLENQNRIFNAFSPFRATTTRPEGESQLREINETKQIDQLKEAIKDGSISLEQANQIIAQQRPGFGIKTTPVQPAAIKTFEQQQATAFGKQFSRPTTKKLSLKKGRKTKKYKIKKIKQSKIAQVKLKQPKFKTYKPKKFKIKKLKSYA